MDTRHFPSVSTTHFHPDTATSKSFFPRFQTVVPHSHYRPRGKSPGQKTSPPPPSSQSSLTSTPLARFGSPMTEQNRPLIPATLAAPNAFQLKFQNSESRPPGTIQPNRSPQNERGPSNLSPQLRGPPMARRTE